MSVRILLGLFVLLLFSFEAGQGPVPRFVDVSERARLNFQHFSGKSARKYLVETMGSGGGFLDYDNNGWQDLFLVNSGPTPAVRSEEAPSSHLFRNNRDGSFEDVTAASGVTNAGRYGMGCAFADYDNDGDVDIYVTNFGPNVLYRNNGDGTFTDVTDQAQVGDSGWSTSTAFGDYDRDGWLDLYVCNYLDFSYEKNVPCYVGQLLTYCHPQAYPGVQNTLYRNLGNGRFENATRRAGLVVTDVENSKSLGVLWTDLDMDGWVDLFVTNDSTGNHLFKNLGDGTFEDISLISGGALSNYGDPQSGMGVDAADFDQKGRLHIVVTNFSYETNALYYNEGKGLFTDRIVDFALATSSFNPLAFGVNFFDFDNDGYFDLFVANGHILDNARETDPTGTLSYEQRNQLFRYNGQGKFIEVSSSAGKYFHHGNVSRGSAVGDFNNDGRMDLLVCNNSGKADLLENRTTSANHWIKVKMQGSHCSRDAVGARVHVLAQDYRLVQEVRAGSSYLSQSDLRLHFGLGPRTRVDSIEIVWPCGRMQKVDPPETVDQTIIVKEQRTPGPSETPNMSS